MGLLDKHHRADLHSWYSLHFELGLLVSLGILVIAFTVPWAGSSGFDIQNQKQETVQMEEVEQTQQVEQPPPPPQPQVPVEVPNEELVEDATIELNAELDMNAAPQNPPPPPPEAEQEEEDEEPEVFLAVEEMPELIGGIGGLQQKINYPEMASKAGVEGRVFIQFVVDKNGNVTEPHVLRGIGAGCDREALRVVREARFKPGRQRGKPVRVKMSIPITFSLN